MNVIDFIVFIIFTVGVVIFGSTFYKKSQSAEAFTLGNSNFPGWVVTMSIFATFVSSISFLALPGKAYQSNWNAFVFSLSIPVASYMAVKFFVPLYRKANSPSAYAYLETRFGLWARIYVSACYLLTQLMRIGTILYLLALPLNAMFGWNIAIIIIVTGLAVMVYSLLGGIQAVMWTDAIQGIILIAGAVISLLVIMFSMPDGPGQIFTIGAEYNKFSLGSFGLSLKESTFWVVLIYGIFINLQNYGIDQNYVQRYMASSSEKEAKKSALYGGLLYIPVSLVFFLIGTALFAYYKVMPDLLPEALHDVNKADQVFPYFIVNGLPTGFTGLLIAAIFAAGMSTVATSLNSSATVFLTDYYKRYKKDNVTEKASMKVLYLSSFIISIFGIAIAVALINVESALDAWWKLASIFSGGMLGLFLLGAFVKKITSRGAVIGVIAGLAIIIWMSLSPYLMTAPDVVAYASPFHGFLTIVFGTAAIFIVGFLSTFLIRSRKKNEAV